MQLGARWRAGETPHRGVPPTLHEAIAAQEAAHPDAHSWTLTFLEGRPRCALDDLVLVTVDAASRVVVTSLRGDSDTDGVGGSARSTTHAAPDSSDEDDDDWLS